MSMTAWPLQAIANAQGKAVATLPSLATGKRWKINFIALQSNSALQSQAQILVNNQPIIGSVSGNFDSASGEPSIAITAKDTLAIVWTGCSAGANCSATIWYEDVRQT